MVPMLLYFRRLVTSSSLFHFRFNVNQIKENEIRNYNARMQPIWDAQKATEKAKRNREELIQLARETGTPVRNGKKIIWFSTSGTWGGSG
jgi:hypothetical protein